MVLATQHLTMFEVFTMYSLLVYCIVLLAIASDALLLQKIDNDARNVKTKNASAVADIWALLVAGSDTWMNYRHQADVCHAYQILRAHGVPDDHIVVMMTDDIAHNNNNPTPGVIINKPNGTNVYPNVPRDYTGKEVTVENFLNIIQGNKEAMRGIGSGKVIESGPDSFVFVNLVDHGAPGIFAFPEEFMHAKQLIEAIEAMHSKQRYHQMVFYVEACESGSLFDGLLSPNINVYATTAANPKENSFACYYDAELETYLGDVYSVKWMEDVDKLGTDETLRKQYWQVKEETKTSHVMHYGNLYMGWDSVSRFMGSKSANTANNDAPKKPCEDAVASGDVPVAILTNRIMAATDEAVKAKLEKQLSEELELRENIRSVVKKIASKVITASEQLTGVLEDKSLPRNFDCIEDTVKLFSERCFNINKVDYAMRHLYVLVNLCEVADMDQSKLEDAIKTIC
ncbi:legumain-like [Dysidea avara]|uniref:legumain-like n=1 Tax=Dysidea avara TaxID=196820 RepID=UPI00332FB206